MTNQQTNQEPHHQYCEDLKVQRLAERLNKKVHRGVFMFANQKWEDFYLRAILEVSSQKMPQRITATRQAISGRLHDLEHDSDHHAERQQIVDALRALAVLEIETQEW